MAWQCEYCGQQREGEEPGNTSRCPSNPHGRSHWWRYYESAADIARKQAEIARRQADIARKQASRNTPTVPIEDVLKNTASSYSSDDDCKYSIAQNIILLIEIVVGLIAGYIVRIDADISWNLLVYIGLQVTAVVMGKHDGLNVSKRLVGSVCLYIFEAVVAQMCLSGGPFSFVIMLIVGVAPYFIYVAIPNIKEGNSIFGED